MELLLILALLLLLTVCVVRAAPEVVIREGVVNDAPARGPDGVRECRVVLPRVWVKATEALVAAHHQAGLTYAIVPAAFDAPVGPFPPGEPITVDELARRVAAATGARLTWTDNVAVLDPCEKRVGPLFSNSENSQEAALNDTQSAEKRGPTPFSGGPLGEVSALDGRGDLGAVVRLTELAGHEDGSVRVHALAALQRMEGDFLRGAYPGRVSIFEVLADRIDREALLCALEEGGPLGSRVWKLAVEILGRARARVLSRYLWWHVWLKPDGVMEVGLWAQGRCGDPSAAWSMRGRIRDPFTNDPSHRYLAAMSLGQLNAISRLVADIGDPDADIRRAIAFGLGFCEAEVAQAPSPVPTQPGAAGPQEHLVGLIDDDDPSVRFVACQSLARLGTDAADGRLKSLAADGRATADVRTAAMEALVVMGRPGAAETVLAVCADPDPLVRSHAAALLAEVGTSEGQARLLELADDPDRRVRCAAVCSLARLGTAEGIGRAASALTAEGANVDERIAALLGLGRSYAPDAADPLAKVARDATQPERLRQYAVLGLARLLRPIHSPSPSQGQAQPAGGGRGQDPAARKETTPHPDPLPGGERGSAPDADRAVRQHLRDLADETSPAYLSLAVRELALETPAATAAFLIPYLTHAGREGACAAAGRLAEIGYGPAVVELLEGSDIFDNHTRMMHMWGTIRAGGRGVTMALVEATRNKRGTIRRTAAFALGGRLYPEAIDALLRLARDANWRVRAAAAQSLGITPDPRAIDALIDLATKDENLRVAHEAVRALRLRDYRHLPEVQAALEPLVGTQRDAGGIGPKPPPLADQPDHSFVLRAWAEHVEEDLVSSLTYEASICYDSHNGRAVHWGAHGRRYDTPQTAQTWLYDPNANQWTRLTTSREWPNGVCGVRGTMFDRTNKAVVSPRSGGSNGHGWHNALRANLMHSSPWVFDVTTDQWYAARTEGFWGGGYMPSSHDPLNGINVWWRGGLKGFDVYANRWIDIEPDGPAPACPGDTGGEFDPKTGRFIAVAADATWAFDPAANRWTDLKPAGDHPPVCPMVYDTANDVMLSFKALEHEVGVWVYHLRENRWERLPAVAPCPARGKIWDLTYDERDNVVIIPVTEPHIGQTASLTNRETWTYRYRGGPKSAATSENGNRGVPSPLTGEGKGGGEHAGLAPAAPRDVHCATAADGGVTVGWTSDGDADAFRIERGVGDQPWRVEWEQVGEVDGGQCEFGDTPTEKVLTFYRVLAAGSDGSVSPPSVPGRTAPRMVQHVTAVVRPEGGVQLRWAEREGSDAVGYHVYRAAVDLGCAWYERFDPGSVFESLERITESPVAGSAFVDGGATVTGEGDELTWPATFAYVVRPVNSWGVEGGPSPVTLALPDPPGPVRIVPWADGRRLVLWSTCLSGHVVGYHLHRMDDWHRHHVFRLQPAPLASPGFWDTEDVPTHDRRRYAAVGVDPLGALGHPTSGAWSHGYP